MSWTFAWRWRGKALWRSFGNVYWAFNVFPKKVACGEHVLPEEAAPGVSFEKASRPIPIYEVFAPGSWSPADRERLAGYRMIGSDGAGNPICIEQGTGAVVLVDHEDWFHTRQFINSSVRQLAHCLLAYMGENDAARFRSAVQAIDPAALTEESLWWHEAGRCWEIGRTGPPLPAEQGPNSRGTRSRAPAIASALTSWRSPWKTTSWVHCARTSETKVCSTEPSLMATEI